MLSASLWERTAPSASLKDPVAFSASLRERTVCHVIPESASLWERTLSRLTFASVSLWERALESASLWERTPWESRRMSTNAGDSSAMAVSVCVFAVGGLTESAPATCLGTVALLLGLLLASVYQAF